MHDGTERPITRPYHVIEQAAYYSGKKKRHTIQNILLADNEGTIHYLSATHEGTSHDKAIADVTAYPRPPQSELLQDLGFIGYTLEAATVRQPHKRPPKGTLADEQQADNRALAHRRVRIEHFLASVKRCRIVKDTIRRWKDTARDRVMEIACGLHNFRLRLNPWPAYQ